MKDTGGMRRNHVLLHGLPGCAKSSLFKGVQTVVGHGGYLALNANSATRAGIEAIFLRRLKQTGVPPLVFIEEIEKTLEAILTVWLSLMDERAELRKVTNNEANRVETRVLCFGSANDKLLFDKLMGGRPGHPGALSSRFTKPLYVPRPNRDTMRRILLRDIKLYGGNPLWADKALEIADEVGTNDPRIVLAYLDGGERLLNGKYKEDIMAIHKLEQQDKESEPLQSEE
jgi:MoxR-like ATPase